MFVHLSLNTCKCVEITNQLPFNACCRRRPICVTRCVVTISIYGHIHLWYLYCLFFPLLLPFVIRFYSAHRPHQRSCFSFTRPTGMFDIPSCVLHQERGTYKLEHVWLSLQHHVTHIERGWERVQGLNLFVIYKYYIILFKTNSAFFFLFFLQPCPGSEIQEDKTCPALN